MGGSTNKLLVVETSSSSLLLVFWSVVKVVALLSTKSHPSIHPRRTDEPNCTVLYYVDLHNTVLYSTVHTVHTVPAAGTVVVVVVVLPTCWWYLLLVSFFIFMIRIIVPPQFTYHLLRFTFISIFFVVYFDGVSLFLF